MCCLHVTLPSGKHLDGTAKSQYMLPAWVLMGVWSVFCRS